MKKHDVEFLQDGLKELRVEPGGFALEIKTMAGFLSQETGQEITVPMLGLISSWRNKGDSLPAGEICGKLLSFFEEHPTVEARGELREQAKRWALSKKAGKPPAEIKPDPRSGGRKTPAPALQLEA